MAYVYSKMVIKNAGQPLSLSEIRAEMGTSFTGAISLASFRASGQTKARGVTGIPTTGAISFSKFYGKTAIPVVSGLAAKYTGESWTGSALVDETGSTNNATSTRGAIKVGTSAYTGLKRLWGDTTDGIQFPFNLPQPYTLFVLTRYNLGVPDSSRGRLVEAYGETSIGTGNWFRMDNWFTGHHLNKAGCAYHGTAWVHEPPASHYYVNTWVLSTDQVQLYRSNQILRGTGTGAGYPKISINYGAFTGALPEPPNYPARENSSWAFYCLFLYNRALSTAEIEEMEAYIRATYKTLILTTYTWYTLFDRINSTAFTITQAGSNPNVQLQMNSNTALSSETDLWYNQRIQSYESFVAEFEINMGTGGGGSSFVVGASSGNFSGAGPNAPGFTIHFSAGNPRASGVYLFDNSNATQVAGSTAQAYADNTWRSVRVVYTKTVQTGSPNTWQVWLNNVSIITYITPSNATWADTTSGTFFGFASTTTASAGHNFSVRRVTLSIYD